MAVHDWVLDSPVQLALVRALEDNGRQRGADLAYDTVREATAALAPPGFTGTLSGADSGAWIEAALEALAARAATLDALHERSAYWWLWVLRRVPDRLFADPAFGAPIQRHVPDGLFTPDASAPAYRNRLIAEALGGAASGPPERLAVSADPDKGLTDAFAADREVGHRVATLVGFAVAVGRFMTMRLLGSAGAEFTFSGGPVPNVSLRGLPAVTTLFGEWRLARQARLDRLGVHPSVSQDHSAPGSASDPAVLLLHRRQGPQPMPAARVVDGLESPISELAEAETFQMYYRLERHSLKSFAGLLAMPLLRDWAVWHPDLPATLAGLLVAAYCFQYGAKARLRALALGYIAVRRSELIELYDTTRPAVDRVLGEMLAGLTPPVPQTGEQLIDSLASLRPNAMRLTSGPGAVESDDGWIALNFAGLTERFAQALEYPGAQGEIANVRARAFEASLQARIDETSWAPPSSLRRYVNVDLRRNGRTIGEVDAIAHKAGITILVSAKSILIGDPYILGDFAARREAAGKVVSALERWRTLLADLAADPAPARGNFDLRGAGKLVGIVSTPNALTVPVDVAVRPTGLPGLPEYVSVDELTAWLHNH